MEKYEHDENVRYNSLLIVLKRRRFNTIQYNTNDYKVPLDASSLRKVAPVRLKCKVAAATVVITMCAFLQLFTANILQ